MAGQGADEELRSEVGRLSYRLEEAREQLGALRIRVTSCSALALLLASLIVPMYSELDDGETEVTLKGLAEAAADAGNGAVQTLAVIAVVTVILTMVLTLASIFEDDRSVGWAQGVAAGLLLAVWVVLLLAVGNSEGGGRLDELGFGSTVRTALVPTGAVMSLVALRVARQVRD
jgi:hypothetical protein